MKLNHYYILPVSLLIALLVPVGLTAVSSAFAAESASVEAIQAISSKWKKATSAGFTDSQEAQSVMSVFEDDKAALTSTGDADFKTAVAEAQYPKNALMDQLSELLEKQQEEAWPGPVIP
ncbi:hypothetical protein [uncultured Desulfobacter sp.]|uniref:hypothetical protein n=1 Tax=uncultured Desulfobacter sp. TaxID=240139 RepID=UPI0029F49FAA|nr:hypothetical protein [uncultured Desulfobacter sp.]